MRHHRRGRSAGLEFAGSGEDSFVAVVVTKLTGALLFILLLTMVIMALIPRAEYSSKTAQTSEPLKITTESPLPDAIAGRAYSLALAARGGAGPVAWLLEGTLPEGLVFDPETATIQGTPSSKSETPVILNLVARDDANVVRKAIQLEVYAADDRAQPAAATAAPSRLEWQDWLDRGFGYLVVAVVWMAALNLVAAMQRWSEDRSELLPPKGRSLRFLGYRLAVTAIAVGACGALWVCSA